MTVIVADDLNLVLSLVSAILSDSFEVVGQFSDGSSALKATLALEPDAVVLDISMPGMSGIQVAQELRRTASKTKIALFSPARCILLGVKIAPIPKSTRGVLAAAKSSRS